MGYIVWIALLVFVAFKGHGLAKQHKNNAPPLYQEWFWAVIIIWFLGFASLYYGIGLPTTGTSITALLFSSLTIFLFSYFLEKSDFHPFE